MRFATTQRLALAALLTGATHASAAIANDSHLLTNTRIWNSAPHNAFTDLTYFNNQFYVTFREAIQHTVPAVGTQGGDIRVLRSSNGTTWTSAKLFDFGIDNDLRDPKLAVTPDNRLMVLGTDVPHDGSARQSYAWFSNDGTTWTNPASTGLAGRWLWRVEWSGNTAYGISYSNGTRLHTSTDGVNYSTLVSPLTSVVNGISTNEAAFLKRRDGSAVTIVRRDPDAPVLVGTSSGALTNWTFRESNYFVGGPDMVELPDGRIVVGGRFTDESVDHTKLAFLDLATGDLQPFLTLTSSGDTGYPGLMWRDNKLWASYYASQSGKASIYLASISFDNVPEPGALTACALGVMVVGRRVRSTSMERRES